MVLGVSGSLPALPRDRMLTPAPTCPALVLESARFLWAGHAGDVAWECECPEPTAKEEVVRRLRCAKAVL